MKRIGPKVRRTRQTPKQTHDSFFDEDPNDLAIAELEFPTRTVNTLEEAGILSVKDFLRRGRDELLALPNFGESSLKDCLAKLKERDFDVTNLVARKKKVAIKSATKKKR